MTKAMKRVTCLACVAVMGLGAAMFAACEKEGGNNPGGDPNREVEEILISGSSSVTPLMEKLAEVYESFNPYVDITVQGSDSGTGVADTIAGKNDFGMASRDLKDSETEQGVTSESICLDGVALVVNPNAELEGRAIRSISSMQTVRRSAPSPTPSPVRTVRARATHSTASSRARQAMSSAICSNSRIALALQTARVP